MSINNIKNLAHVRGGFAKPNRFRVDLSALGSGGFATISSGNDIADLNFMVESIAIPGKTTSSFEYAIWNHPIKIPTGYDEDDIEIMFMVTNDFLSRRIVEEWYGKVIDQKNYLMAYDADYKYDIKIYQESDISSQNQSASTSVYGVHIQGAYPTSVKGMLLDNNSENAISRFSATFAYNRYDVISQEELKRSNI